MAITKHACHFMTVMEISVCFLVILVCNQNGNHSLEDVEKVAYTGNKVQIFDHPSRCIFGGDFGFFSFHFWQLKNL